MSIFIYIEQGTLTGDSKPNCKVTFGETSSSVVIVLSRYFWWLCSCLLHSQSLIWDQVTNLSFPMIQYGTLDNPTHWILKPGYFGSFPVLHMLNIFCPDKLYSYSVDAGEAQVRLNRLISQLLISWNTKQDIRASFSTSSKPCGTLDAMKFVIYSHWLLTEEKTCLLGYTWRVWKAFTLLFQRTETFGNN